VRVSDYLEVYSEAEEPRPFSATRLLAEARDHLLSSAWNWNTGLLSDMTNKPQHVRPASQIAQQLASRRQRASTIRQPR
jgi:hypothetical protein